MFILLLATSCVSERRLAKKCAARFPVASDTTIIPGATVYDTAWMPPEILVFTDTVRVDCDTIRGVVTVPVYKSLPCHPASVIRSHTRDTFLIKQEDTAKLTVATNKLADAERWNIVLKVLAGLFAILFVMTLILRK